MIEPQDEPIQRIDITKSRSGFPVLHMVFGSVFGIMAPLLCMWTLGFIFDMFSLFRNTKPINNLLSLLWVGEIIVIAILLWFIFRNYRTGDKKYMRSYITIAVINVLAFSYMYIVLAGVHC
jgi:hypothetical protein